MAKRTKPVLTLEELTLNEAQRFFVDNHAGMTDEQLTEATGASLDAVRFHRKNSEATPPRSNYDAAMHKPREGVVAMTEGAAMLGDNLSRRGWIGEGEIKAARARGEHELADEMEARRKEQMSERQLQERARVTDHVFRY